MAVPLVGPWVRAAAGAALTLPATQPLVLPAPGDPGAWLSTLSTLSTLTRIPGGLFLPAGSARSMG